jgi:hypothetical protein
MSESKALILALTINVLVVSVAYIGLTLAHATMATLTAVIVVIGCLAAHGLSRVVMHYAPPEQRRR